MQIRKISENEKTEALNLVLEVFMQYEAPVYSEEGVRTFTSFISNRENIDSLEMYVAVNKNKIAGVIATRNNGNHVALFFVDGKWHRQGIGRRLFEKVLENSTADSITVNASPYAVDVYHKLGFINTGEEQVVDGMRFTPMVCKK
jgi:GNAT superfamily N-acetyltransferase